MGNIAFNLMSQVPSEKGIGVVKQTLDRCYHKLNRLYEKGASKRHLVAYVKKSTQWVKGGVILMIEPLLLNNNTHRPKKQLLAYS